MILLFVAVTKIGIVPKDILKKGKIKGFINMVVFAAVIPSLAKISLTDLVKLFEERKYLISKIMPKLVVGGMACMISIVVAGVMAGLL